jgi:predicted deacylase
MNVSKVDIGEIVEIPVYDSGMEGTGPTVLITGGMDGDEYAGIEAAKQLGKRIENGEVIAGRVIVIPVVNVLGNNAGTSWNPRDGKYPKSIYPGSSRGSSTDKLVAWLTSYIWQASVWIDLHGGAHEEELTPFVGSYETRVSAVNAMTKNLAISTRSQLIHYQTNSRSQKAELLAKKGCSYLLFESGDQGRIISSDVTRHISWCHRVLSHLGMIKEKTPRADEHSLVFSEVHEYFPKEQGIWTPIVSAGQTVFATDLLGTYETEKGNVQSIYSRQNGIVLWNFRKNFPVCKKNVVVAIAKIP